MTGDPSAAGRPRLEGAGRRHGPRGPWVLRGVDLGLPPAALVRVTGTNGTGKSTLLRLLAGIDAPTEGRVTGRPARTAYVPERFPVALPFTALDYLVRLGRVQGLGRTAARARAGEWLERFGAGGHARTGLAELSKGMSQKVAVAQALLADPDLLVLDEAWTGLDAGARAALDAAVRERVAAGATVVFVDHDPRRLRGEADAVYEVAAGRVRPGREPAGEPPGALRAPGTPRAPDAPGTPGAPGISDAPGAPSTLSTPGAPETPGAPSTLSTLSTPDAPDASGALVRITVSGGRALPARPPGEPAVAPGPDGTTVLTVGEAHSDALLGALLAASWHVHRLHTGRTEPSEGGVRA